MAFICFQRFDVFMKCLEVVLSASACSKTLFGRSLLSVGQLSLPIVIDALRATDKSEQRRLYECRPLRSTKSELEWKLTVYDA